MSPEAFVALGAGLAMVKTKTVMGAVRLAVHGRTFATVGWPQPGWAVVKLSPQDQRGFVATHEAIAPEPGYRGRKGVTLVRLGGVNDGVAARLLVSAWQLALSSPTSIAKAG